MRRVGWVGLTARPFSPSRPRRAKTRRFAQRGPSSSATRATSLGSGQGCPLLRASNEHSFTVRVLRARRAPGRSLFILLRPRVARARDRPSRPFLNLLENMPHLILFRPQILHVSRARLDLYRHTLDDLQPIAFDTDNLAWIVRDEPDLV
jgi:hypothetical protein